METNFVRLKNCKLHCNIFMTNSLPGARGKLLKTRSGLHKNYFYLAQEKIHNKKSAPEPCIEMRISASLLI